MPVSRTAFDNGLTSGGNRSRNITLWSKYRFFRKLNYGDRQPRRAARSSQLATRSANPAK